MRTGSAVAVILCGLTQSVSAEQTMDGATARIEIWRHARLQATRVKPGAEIAAFTTDGCSGGMSSVWAAVAATFPGFNATYEAKPPWAHCCVTHDHAYHLGGEDSAPEMSFQARLAADELLRFCVADEAYQRDQDFAAQYGRSVDEIDLIFKFVADRMYDAVRLGGAPCSGFAWRWGYGWPQCW